MVLPARSGGVEGNARLTASAAVALLVLLAIEGVTILFIRSLLPVHVFVGMMLIPPIALKLASVGWRLLRYYTGSPAYRLRGAPRFLVRILVAPAVLASALLLFGSGVALLVVGPAGGLVLGLGKVSFVLWLGATSAHVVAHLFKLPRLATADLSRHRRLPSSGLRFATLGGVPRRRSSAGSRNPAPGTALGRLVDASYRVDRGGLSRGTVRQVRPITADRQLKDDQGALAGRIVAHA